jgi:hypothetical protein
LTKWGIKLVALWALVLTILSLANLLLLTSIVQIGTTEGPTQTQIWIVFLLNVLFLFGFGASTYGLFRRTPWGRILFLWVVSIWAGANLMALFVPLFATGQRDFQGQILSIIRYAVALVLPLWYLNLPQVKSAFQPSSEKTGTEIQ